MSRLAIAVERKEWTVVALCLLIGVAEAASKLPPDAVTGLLELLEGPSRDQK